MELYYNPEQMRESEIKDTFVARQWLIDELLSVIRRQPKGAGVQHAVVIGPRGMGKTTILLMIRFTVLEGELGKKWLAVRFPEESYGINDLADFWLATIAHLAYESSDTTLIGTADALKRDFKEAGALCDAAIAVLRDWSRSRKRRLILLVDNLDMVLDQINDTTENARLREVLMNDGVFMIIGTATSFFKEVRKYEQPLYNFFRTYNLDSLNSEQVNELLRQRAAVDKKEDFDERMKQNKARINVLHYFTGGNPRLVLMLYRIISSSEFIEVRRGLDKLLDEVTPYYKAKVEILPSQQRKLLDHVARVSGRTHEGLTPTQIAQDTRLPVNQVSAQLKRLSDLGYVRAANIRSKNSFYSLAEPLYAIWHQMRFGRESRERMEWLIEFLKGWYTSREIVEQTEILTNRFGELLRKGESSAAIETLEYRRYLSSAMDPGLRGGAVDRLVCDCLEAGELHQIREILRDNDVASLTMATILRLGKDGFITTDQVRFHKERAEVILQQLAQAEELLKAKDWQRLLSLLDGIKPYFHRVPKLWFFRAATLVKLNRKREALQDYDTGLAIVHDKEEEWRRAALLYGLHDYHAAIKGCDRIINKDPGNGKAHFLRAACLLRIGRFEEAVSSAERAGDLSEGLLQSLRNLTHLSKDPAERFVVLIAAKAFDEARLAWHELVNAANTEDARSNLAGVVTTCMEPDNVAFLRELIRETNLDEVLFPVSRALDYVLTGDRNITERLSAEVRPIVDEIISKYEQKQSGGPEQRGRRKIPISKRHKP